MLVGVAVALSPSQSLAEGPPALAAQGNGKILVTVPRGKALKVARLRSSGKLDRSFGHHGYASLGLSDQFVATDILVQPSGAIDIAAMAITINTADQYVIRLTKNGRLDRAFGNNGMVKPFIEHRGYKSGGLASSADGHLLVGGVGDTPGCARGGSGDCRYMQLVASLESDGQPDPGFGAGGVSTLPIGGTEVELAVAADGRIVTGSSFFNTSYVSRLMPDGSLDPSFGAGAGYVETATRISAVAVDASGGVFAGGGGAGMFATTALDSDGTLDEGFADAGSFALSLGPSTVGGGGSLLREFDGDLILGGPVGSRCHGNDSAQARSKRCRLSAGLVSLDPAGDLDPGFSDDGIARLKISRARARFTGGRIVVASSSEGLRVATPVFLDPSQDQTTGIAVIAVRDDGRVDRNYGRHGRSFLPFE